MEKKYEIGRRIKQRREELKMTQEELGKLLWLNKSTIQRYESGKISNIKIPIIHAMAGQLDVDPDWLMLDSNEMGHFVPRFEKYEQWRKENQNPRKVFQIDGTNSDIHNKFYEMVDLFCQLNYETADEGETFKKIIKGLEELNPNGLKKVLERIRELEYIPDCNNTGLTFEDIIRFYEQNHEQNGDE